MKHVLTLFLSIGLGQCLHADLMQSDFATPGDNLLVTDTSTNLQWLKPTYTTNQTYNDTFIQNLISTDGFRYATVTEVMSMLDSNFNNPPVGVATAIDYTDDEAIFNVFGAPSVVTCNADGFEENCQVFIGVTGTPSTAPGYHDSVELATYPNGSPGFGAAYGYLFDTGGYPDNPGYGSFDVGYWLVRDAATQSPVPEPASLGLLAGVCGIIGFKARRWSRDNFSPKRPRRNSVQASRACQNFRAFF